MTENDHGQPSKLCTYIIKHTNKANVEENRNCYYLIKTVTNNSKQYVLTS